MAITAATGRGLALVGAVSDSWGVRSLPGGGEVVWAEVGTGRGSPARR